MSSKLKTFWVKDLVDILSKATVIRPRKFSNAQNLHKIEVCKDPSGPRMPSRT